MDANTVNPLFGATTKGFNVCKRRDFGMDFILFYFPSWNFLSAPKWSNIQPKGVTPENHIRFIRSALSSNLLLIIFQRFYWFIYFVMVGLCVPFNQSLYADVPWTSHVVWTNQRPAHLHHKRLPWCSGSPVKAISCSSDKKTVRATFALKLTTSSFFFSWCNCATDDTVCLMHDQAALISLWIFSFIQVNSILTTIVSWAMGLRLVRTSLIDALRTDEATCIRDETSCRPVVLNWSGFRTHHHP